MEIKINAPILLIGFNRPDVMRQSFEYIRNAKPAKLYIAIDGPRQEKKGEDVLVEEVRRIVKDVDWDCETHYRFNDQNRGAELTVSSAVSWALDKEEYVIVLEDDIIAPISFLRFAEEMLIRYKNTDNLYMISGGQFSPIEMDNNEDYLFANYGHTGCGWATWKRAWSHFDLNIYELDNFLTSESVNKYLQDNTEKKYWASKIKEMKQKGIGQSSWDICWSFIRLRNCGLSIIPRVNLTSNIGVYGLHSRGQTSGHFRSYDKDFVASVHPREIKCNTEYDNYHFHTHINRRPTILQRAVGRFLRTLKLN